MGVAPHRLPLEGPGKQPALANGVPLVRSLAEDVCLSAQGGSPGLANRNISSDAERSSAILRSLFLCELCVECHGGSNHGPLRNAQKPHAGFYRALCR